MPLPVHIDTDPAAAHALARLMALRHRPWDVKAVTVVAGNVSLPQATRNALYCTQLCNADIPVHPGADRPLTRPHEHADWFHGRDGLGDRGFAPSADRKPHPEHAVDTIIRTARENPGLLLVTLGPLTNLALAIAKDPTITKHFSRVVIMGGNPCCEGNVTPAAEYNIWVDPEAAQRVFRAALPIELVGWHLCRGQANLLEPDIARIRALDTDIAHFAIDCNAVAMQANRTQSGELGIALPDPTAMAIAIDPAIAISVSDHLVEIETQSDLTRGQTVVDRLNVAHDPRNRGTWSTLATDARPAKIIWTLDIPRWKQLLYDLIKGD